MNSLIKLCSLLTLSCLIASCSNTSAQPSAPGPCDHIKNACLRSACNMLGFEPTSKATRDRFNCGGSNNNSVGSESEWEAEQLERRVFDLEMKDRYGK